MNRLPRTSTSLLWLVLLAAPAALLAEPSPAALTLYANAVDAAAARLTAQHRRPETYMALSAAGRQRLRRGDLMTERLTPADSGQAGSLLHDWRGSAFAPGATVADVESVLSAFDHYPQFFAPQVLSAHVLSGAGDHLQTEMRVRQQHILTVVLDIAYDVHFERFDPSHGASVSRSTRIAEIADAGSPAEHALKPGQEHGFLWRQDTFWSYEQRDGGLYLQLESLSLTRALPRGLGWAVEPLVESVPRESLAFTLRATMQALRTTHKGDLQ